MAKPQRLRLVLRKRSTGRQWPERVTKLDPDDFDALQAELVELARDLDSRKGKGWARDYELIVSSDDTWKSFTMPGGDLPK